MNGSCLHVFTYSTLPPFGTNHTLYIRNALLSFISDLRATILSGSLPNVVQVFENFSALRIAMGAKKCQEDHLMLWLCTKMKSAISKLLVSFWWKRSSRGDSVELWLDSVMMADAWWCRSRIGLLSRVECSQVVFYHRTRSSRTMSASEWPLLHVSDVAISFKEI